MPDPYILREPTKTRPGWRISSDGLSWQLDKGLIVQGRQSGRKAKAKNVGKTAWYADSWYPTISQLLSNLVQLDARLSQESLPVALSESVRAVQGFLRELEQGLTIEVKL